jgi:hypothetical protein
VNAGLASLVTEGMQRIYQCDVDSVLVRHGGIRGGIFIRLLVSPHTRQRARGYRTTLLNQAGEEELALRHASF